MHGTGRICGTPALRPLVVIAAEVLLQLLVEELAGLRVHDAEAVLVDQHGLVRQPCRPGGLADVGEDALAQLAGVGHEVQAFGVALFVLAEDGARHRSIP